VIQVPDQWPSRADALHHRAIPSSLYAAVGGPARAAGRQSRRGTQGVQRRGVSRVWQARTEHHPSRFRVLRASTGVSVRPGARTTDPDGGRVPEGIRRGGARDRRRVRTRGRGSHQRAHGRRHPGSLRPLERAGFYKADQDKQFKHLVRVGSAAAGNAATRIEAFVVSTGIRSHGGYPDIDGLFRDQSSEMDRRSARACCTRSSSSCTSGRCSRRS